ncbi:MAG: hypothetical protein MJ225_04115 [Bacilli bacterium]|nr:hypothetical protein [Bacilli bacterium]
MEMKNKLFKHHRSKLAVVTRKISIAALSVAGVFAVVALPTYFSISSSNKIEAQATAEKQEKKEQEKLPEAISNNE